MSTFLSVADSHGFAAAGRKLGLSPPAVTRAISELEVRLGVQLLTRTTRVVRLTDAGIQYAEDCRKILAEVERAEQSAGRVHTDIRGNLLLTAPALFGQICIVPIITGYLRVNSEVNVACWFTDSVIDIVSEGVDVAVRIGNLPDSSLHAIKVGKLRNVLCATPEYLINNPPLRVPDDLKHHTIISTSDIALAPEWTFLVGGSPTTLKISPRISLTTKDSSLEATLDGFGIACLKSFQIAPFVKAGKLVELLTEFELPPSPIQVVYREGRRASNKVRSLVDLLVSKMCADPLFGMSQERSTAFNVQQVQSGVDISYEMDTSIAG
jgi:DNA-binding transcriptional LysR family regulator